MSRFPPAPLIDRDGDITMTMAEEPFSDASRAYQPFRRNSVIHRPPQDPYWRQFTTSRTRSAGFHEPPLPHQTPGLGRPLATPSTSLGPQPFPINASTDSVGHIPRLPSLFRGGMVDVPRGSDLEIGIPQLPSTIMFEHDLKLLARLNSALTTASEARRSSLLGSSISNIPSHTSSVRPDPPTLPPVQTSLREQPRDTAGREGSASPPFRLRTRDSLELIEQGLLQPHHRPAEPLQPHSSPAPNSLDNAYEEITDSATTPIWRDWTPTLHERVLPPIHTDPAFWPRPILRPDSQSFVPQQQQQQQPQPQQHQHQHQQTPRPRHRRRMSRPSIPWVSCTACMDEFKLDDLLTLACACRYCTPCLNAAFRAGCTNMASFPPKCCGRPLRISVWGSLLEADILTRYKEIEAEFSANRPLYCASQKCSAFLPEEVHIASREVGLCSQCQESTCKRCRCLMSDHPVWNVENRVCPAEDVNLSALFALGSEKRWKQCPTCLNMVERIEGCNHMDCVCGVEFCYRCGKLFDEDDSCDCDPNSLDEDEDGEEDDEDGEDDGDDTDEDEWPNFRLAVDALGRPSCLHINHELLGTNDFACHGCLQVDRLFSCHDCGLELCESCLDRVQRRAMLRTRDGWGMSDEDQSEDESDESADSDGDGDNGGERQNQDIDDHDHDDDEDDEIV